jgi:Fe-S oxidoreductase
MNIPTIFDLISDTVIWHCSQCTWCNGELDEDPDREDIIIRVYRGAKGHKIFVAYHETCYTQRSNLWGKNIKKEDN